MEESHSQYLTWTKRKQILKSHLQEPVRVCNNSWEERAFAEDAARTLGGCIWWPQRSYSCSFCKREFRSAQALGGHMNVHRRDRARLKQNLSPHNNDCKSLGAQFSADICSQLDSPATGRLSPSRLSALSTLENCGQQTIFPCPASSISWGKQKGCPNSEPEAVINAREEDFRGLSCNHVETELSVGLNPMFRQTLPSGSCGDEAMIISCKRPKTTSISSLPVFLKPCSNDRLLAFPSAEIVLELRPGMEDLDLELRLGKQQKVK